MKKIAVISLILLVLLILVCIQVYFFKHSLFRQYPHTGIVLHLVGGACVYLLITISIRFFFNQLVSKKDFLIGLIGVFVIEICWELIEVILGWNDRQALSYYLYNTLGDIFVTVAGALLIIFVVFLMGNKK